MSDLEAPEMDALLDAIAGLWWVEHDACVIPLDDYGRAWPDAPCVFDTVPLGYAREVEARSQAEAASQGGEPQ